MQNIRGYLFGIRGIFNLFKQTGCPDVAGNVLHAFGRPTWLVWAEKKKGTCTPSDNLLRILPDDVQVPADY